MKKILKNRSKINIYIVKLVTYIALLFYKAVHV